ncbi:MalY/PatB family protein [Brassicibacter mesophilus]|uniref:MalY/PatB family protein n=1 Tax=Brassicibacter mesophilus TaxID=745119 RepID=UPI003D20CBAE
MYNFDEVIERRGTDSVKWDLLIERYGRDDLLSLWVADMDFKPSIAIQEALEKKARDSVFGYTFVSDSYYDAVISWMKKRHNWDVKKEWIKTTPGVVTALSHAIKAFTNPGDEVIVQSPVYYPFYSAIRNNGCQIINNPLIYKDNTYVMDYEDLERKISPRTKLLFLCNPHNPVGRVWTRNELLKLGEICLKNNIIIISDEIHFDLIHKGYNHTVMATVSSEIKENCIVCTAPSKTFNIAGLQVSNIIIPNDNLRKVYNNELENSSITEPNLFGMEALKVAYSQCEDWLEEVLEYVEGNIDFFTKYIEKNIPQLKVIKPEGTYLIWVDCSKLHMNPKELRDFFINKCRIALDDGEIFGKEGEQFQRFNVACPRSILEETLKRIEQAVKAL